MHRQLISHRVDQAHQRKEAHRNIHRNINKIEKDIEILIQIKNLIKTTEKKNKAFTEVFFFIETIKSNIANRLKPAFLSFQNFQNSNGIVVLVKAVNCIFYLLRDTCCASFAARHLLRVICCTSFAVRHLLREICCASFAALHLLHGICCTSFAARHLLRGICCASLAAMHLLRGTCCATALLCVMRHMRPCFKYVKCATSDHASNANMRQMRL